MSGGMVGDEPKKFEILEKEKECQGDHNNTEQTTVAAFLPWRGS